MKKLNIACFIFGLFTVNAVYANNSLFSPKLDGIDKDQLNDIVKQKLDQQKIHLESDFSIKIEELKLDMERKQNEQIANILSSIEELKEERNNYNQSNNNSNILYHNDNSVITDEEVNAELEVLLHKDENEDTFIIPDELIRLNEEFGEKGLSFVGIVDNHKVYKNSDNEYIIKNLDFDYQAFKEKEIADQNAASNSNIIPTP